MADDKMNNDGFNLSSKADTLKEIPEQIEIDRNPLPAYNTLDYRPGDILLDTYRVESDAVKGGMGAVWRVHHIGWNVDLAMKRPRSEAFSNEGQKKDFTDECKNWIDLGLHPNIVSCYYVREIEGIPTIFSEWMDNGCLEDHINCVLSIKNTQNRKENSPLSEREFPIFRK